MNWKSMALTAAAMIVAGPAAANSTITAMGAKLAANPAAASGACPQTITFNGYVAVSGGVWDPAHPAHVAFQFLRSDGANGPVTYFDVSHPGKHAVSDTWTLGGATLPVYNGWEQIKAWATAGGGAALSNKAVFHMECRVRREGPSPRP